MSQVLTKTEQRCPNCQCGVGYTHRLGCDVEQCPICGHQFNKCSCDAQVVVQFGRSPWSGEWPSTADARRANFYCTYNPTDGSRTPCERNTKFARPDLARVREEGYWVIDDQKFVVIPLDDRTWF